MITPIRPGERAVRAFLERQRARRFSYPEVGATGDGTTRPEVPGYTHDYDRVRLGEGEAVWERARAGLRAWRMFEVEGVALCWPDAAIEVGTAVAVLARLAPLWTLDVCRIVHRVELHGAVERFGFAYGTVEGHVMDGEEVFAVEWRRDDDSVWWERRAFSRPRHPFARIGRPLLRGIQARFATASAAAMRRAVASDSGQA
jgi:uncharacterized protein (UPF0548 family)